MEEEKPIKKRFKISHEKILHGQIFPEQILHGKICFGFRPLGGAGSVTVFCITCNPSAKKLQIWDTWREWSQVEKAANFRLAKFAFTSSSTLPGYDDNDDDDDDDDDDDGEDDDDDDDYDDDDDDDDHHQQ